MATKNNFQSSQFVNQLNFIDIDVNNRELIELNLKRRLDFKLKPELFYPWWRRCAVKVLLVTDGGLNFGEGASVCQPSFGFSKMKLLAAYASS